MPAWRQDPVLMYDSATGQIILLAVGHLHRMKSNYVSNITRSSLYLHAVSNRLDASLPRARWLGMIVGTAISRLVDPPDNVMKFEELDNEEAAQWRELVATTDRI